MYSRNSWDKRDNYSLPPGYDGSRFRRRRRRDESGQFSEDEVIIVPDSSYATLDDTVSEPSQDSGELSIGGIPTDIGIRRQKKRSALAEDVQQADTTAAPDIIKEDAPTEINTNENGNHAKEKITGILEKLGFSGGLSSDDLLLCAVIFIIASDTERDGHSVGDILLILALLLGIK